MCVDLFFTDTLNYLTVFSTELIHAVFRVQIYLSWENEEGESSVSFLLLNIVLARYFCLKRLCGLVSPEIGWFHVQSGIQLWTCFYFPVEEILTEATAEMISECIFVWSQIACMHSSSNWQSELFWDHHGHNDWFDVFIAGWILLAIIKISRFGQRGTVCLH